MAEVTLGQCAAQFLETVKGPGRQAALAELNRFTRWYGEGRPIGNLRGHDVATYGEIAVFNNQDTAAALG